MKVRLNTIGIPAFRHEGLVLGRAWVEFDMLAVPESIAQTIVAYHGKFLRTHPDDVGEWAKVGLRLTPDNRLVPIEAAPVDPVLAERELRRAAANARAAAAEAPETSSGDAAGAELGEQPDDDGAPARGGRRRGAR